MKKRELTRFRILFALKMAPVEGRNVRSMFLTSCLTVIFEFKLPVLLFPYYTVCLRTKFNVQNSV